MMDQLIGTLWLACLAAALPAQLSGDYTIDPVGSGTRNFKTFSDAVAAVTDGGVAGSARFTVAPGTFRETISIDPLGAPVTFLGSASGTKIDGVVTLNRPRNVALCGFDFVQPGAVRGEGNDIEISYSRLTGRHRLTGNGYRIHHNVLYRCRIDLDGSDLDFHHNLCTVNDQYNPAIQVSSQNHYVDRVRIRNNLITGTGTAIGFGLAARGDGIDIWHNTISVKSSDQPAVVAVSTSLNATWCSVFNNIFQVEGTSAALRLFNTGYTEMDFNLYDVESGVVGSYGGKTYTSLRDWQRALTQYGNARNGSYELLSLIAAPVFASKTDFRLHPRSPGINYARVDLVSRNGGGPLVTDLDDLHRGNMRDLGAYELTGYRFFGAGCLGTGGNVPFLEIQGDAGPGKYARFLLTKARPAAMPLLLVGVQEASLNLGGSCELLTLPVVMLPTTPVSPTGVSSIEFHLPLNLVIAGATTIAQYAVPDPAAGGLGFAMSRASSIRL